MNSRLHHLRGLATAVLSLGLLSASASATVLLTETFDYPDNTTLNGAGGWSTSYTSPGTPFVVKGGSLDLTSSAGASVREFSATAISSGSLYYGFDFSLSTASDSLNGSYFATLASAPTSGVIRTQQGKLFVKNSGAGYLIGVTASATTSTVQYGSAVFDFGDVHRVVVGYNFVDGLANNTASVYVDGNLLASAVWDTTPEVSLIGFILTHTSTSSSKPLPDSFDNLTVATTYAEAAATAAVPEPSAYAAILGGLALAGVVLRRRRA
ncbi:MAG: PEP-CTERM sorting domain-containing protein [Opitutaceae bacterium]|jgi:hypothetical protein